MNADHRQVSPSAKGTLRRRAAYSLAATAAAGAATNAEAAISYSGLQSIAVGSGFSQNIDLNSDGFNDVLFKNYNFVGGPYQGASVNFFPGKFVGFSSGLSYVSALNAGFMIDAASATGNFAGSMAYGAANPNAQFNNVTDKYVGLTFPAGANNHFGWVRVDVNNAAKTLLIKDWGYETTPSVGIPAGVPEPGTLGMLAAGGLGLAALRKKRQAA